MSTKEKILDVSKSHFAAYGYAGTSMSMIARDVGVKKPSLYSHYNSKEAIFKDVLITEIEKYLLFVKEILENKNRSPVESLYQLFMAHLPESAEEDTDNAFYYRFIKDQPAGLEEYTISKYHDMEKMVFEVFAEVVERGKENAEIDKGISDRQIYDTYFILIDGLHSMTGIYDVHHAEGNIKNVWQVFHRGIKP